MDIRIGITVILHFLVDFLLIVGANSISGYTLGVKKAMCASLVGAVYATVCLMSKIVLLSSSLCRILILLLVSIVAFGMNRDALRRCTLFVLLRLALEGIILGFGNGGFLSLALGSVGICALCLFGFRDHPGNQHYASVRICHGQKTADLTALLDTGNFLQDPISGLPVLVVDYLAAEKLLGITVEQLSRPIDTLASGQYPGLRLIPYTSVGQSSGMLLGLRVDQLLINGKEDHMIVAFAPQQIGRGKPFQALAGVMI